MTGRPRRSSVAQERSTVLTGTPVNLLRQVRPANRRRVGGGVTAANTY